MRLLAEKRRQKVAAKARRKEKQKAAEELDESEEESEDKSKGDLGPSVPKKRRIQEMVSKLSKRKRLTNDHFFYGQGSRDKDLERSTVQAVYNHKVHLLQQDARTGVLLVL